jgi:hypothetical protein
MKKAPTLLGWGPLNLVVVVVYYGLGAITVRIFFFNHGGSVTRLPFLDDCSTISVAVVIMSLADRDASADRANVNTNIIRKRGCRDGADYGGNKQ